MKLTLALIQVVLLVLLSTNTSSTCPNERNLRDDCANPSAYFEDYAAMDCPQLKIVDGLEAQWTFIRNRDIGLRYQFRPYFNNDERNANKFSETVKSLIELHRSIERYLDSDPVSEAAQQMFSAFAKQSCQWLNAVGILMTNCNDSVDYLPLLEAVYYRLDLHDKIKNTRYAARDLFDTYTFKVNYCAWINNKVLGNCSDTQSYNQTTRDTLAKVCDGDCFGRRNSQRTPRIELCSI